MNYVVTIPAIETLFLVGDVPGETRPSLEGPTDWTIETDGWVEVAVNFSEWLSGAAPEMAVGRSLADPKRYKVFTRPQDVPQDQYQTTDWSWGGAYTRDRWEHFAHSGLPALLDLDQIPDNDPPGAMDEVMRRLRRA